MSTDYVNRVCLWSGPRNVSTALMYAFAERPDTTVFDEPLYAAYLDRTGLAHPGRDQVLASQSRDGAEVVANVILGPCSTPVLFIKSMAHHLVGLDRRFLYSLRNVILTRDPADMLPSLARQMPNPSLADTGLREQVALFDEMSSAGRDVPVLDARLLLADPERQLSALCARLGLYFSSEMLTWKAGPRRVDGVWAKYWYENVHASTGFQVYRAHSDAFPERLRPLLDEARPYYRILMSNAILTEDVNATRAAGSAE